MKKLLAVIEFVFGGLLLIVAVFDIPTIIRALAGGNVAYALGAVLGAIIFGCLGVWLIRHGRKTWNSPVG